MSSHGFDVVDAGTAKGEPTSPSRLLAPGFMTKQKSAGERSDKGAMLEGKRTADSGFGIPESHGRLLGSNGYKTQDRELRHGSTLTEPKSSKTATAAYAIDEDEYSEPVMYDSKPGAAGIAAARQYGRANGRGQRSTSTGASRSTGEVFAVEGGRMHTYSAASVGAENADELAAANKALLVDHMNEADKIAYAKELVLRHRRCVSTSRSHGLPMQTFTTAAAGQCMPTLHAGQFHLSFCSCREVRERQRRKLDALRAESAAFESELQVLEQMRVNKAAQVGAAMCALTMWCCWLSVEEDQISQVATSCLSR